MKYWNATAAAALTSGFCNGKACLSPERHLHTQAGEQRLSGRADAAPLSDSRQLYIPSNAPPLPFSPYQDQSLLGVLLYVPAVFCPSNLFSISTLSPAITVTVMWYASRKCCWCTLPSFLHLRIVVWQVFYCTPKGRDRAGFHVCGCIPPHTFFF